MNKKIKSEKKSSWFGSGLTACVSIAVSDMTCTISGDRSGGGWLFSVGSLPSVDLATATLFCFHTQHAQMRHLETRH